MPQTLTSLLRRKTSLRDEEFVDLMGMVTEYGPKLDAQQVGNFGRSVAHLGQRGEALIIALEAARLEAQVQSLLDSFGTRG